MELSFVGSVAELCPTLCNPMECSMPGFPALHYLLKCKYNRLMSIESVMPSNSFIPCYSLLLPLIFPSIRVLPEELASDISLQHLYVEPRIQPSPQRTYALWQLDLIEWQESKAQQMKNSYIISHFRDRLILLHSVVHTLGNCAEPSGEALRLKWRGFSGRCCLFWECLSL